MKFVYEAENGEEFEYSVSSGEISYALTEIIEKDYAGLVGDNLVIARGIALKMLEGFNAEEYFAEIYAEELEDYFREDAMEWWYSESSERIEIDEYERVRGGDI